MGILQKPQPKWHLLKSMNFFVTAIFTGTIGLICYNFGEYNNKLSGDLADLLKNSYVTLPTFYVVILCLCLVYFLGFFGISFLDTDEMKDSPHNFGLQKLQATAERDLNNKKKQQNPDGTDSASSSNGASRGAHNLEPRHDTPICAERGLPSSIPASAGSGAAGADSDKSAAAPAEESGPSIDYSALSDDDVFAHLRAGTLKDHALEKSLGDYERAVCIRRRLYTHLLGQKPCLDNIPYANYDYNKVFGANCEIVVGYIPIPCGIVGPLVINGEPFYVPMATTEGCLVASTNRGCKAISASGGCSGVVLKDAITRAPCIRMPTAMRAAALKKWVEVPENYMILEAAFNSTTNYGRLDSVEATVAGRNVYLRFCCMSGDAMGMNMVSKGCLKAMEVLQADYFPDMVLVAISGNMCTDKKPSAINWILGRGKSVVVEAIIPEKIVKSVLKCSVGDMIETNKQKNLIGSAMAGSIGGFNAHAANIVTALYLATGQDPAQNVESSNCITIMDFADVSHCHGLLLLLVELVLMIVALNRMESHCKLV
jgi:NADP-dependent 3-hydroxy-3-methylglutaryl-CoA reductase